MPFYTYILESEKTGRLYIGQTNNIEDRFFRHNAGHNLSTKAHRPWRLLYFIAFESRSDSMELEKRLKSYKSPKAVREWIARQGEAGQSVPM